MNIWRAKFCLANQFCLLTIKWVQNMEYVSFGIIFYWKNWKKLKKQHLSNFFYPYFTIKPKLYTMVSIWDFMTGITRHVIINLLIGNNCPYFFAPVWSLNSNMTRKIPNFIFQIFFIFALSSLVIRDGMGCFPNVLDAEWRLNIFGPKIDRNFKSRFQEGYVVLSGGSSGF